MTAMSANCGPWETRRIDDAIKQEREACARTVEKSYRELTTQEFDEQTATQCRKHCAALIRARSNE